MRDRIAQLRNTVEIMHRCTARHLKSTPISELFGGEIPRDGVVETCEITGSTQAKRCYAWSFIENEERRYVAVLEIPPIDSAETAVKMAMSASASRISGEGKLKPVGSKRFRRPQ